jgi:hypothetical protein
MPDEKDTAKDRHDRTLNKLLAESKQLAERSAELDRESRMLSERIESLKRDAQRNSRRQF